MRRGVICLVLACVQLGCATSRRIDRIVRVQQSQNDVLSSAPVKESGVYLLRTSPDDPNVQQNPLMLERKLSRGELIGFATEPSGELYAVAGGERIPLERGRRYEWCRLGLEPYPQLMLRVSEPVRQGLVYFAGGAVIVGVIVLSILLRDDDHQKIINL